jgi:hypothetical protein
LPWADLWLPLRGGAQTAQHQNLRVGLVSIDIAAVLYASRG